MGKVYDNLQISLPPKNELSTDSAVSNTMAVSVNGAPRAFPAGSTLLDVVGTLNLDPERLAVELNRTIVKRHRWASTIVMEGAQIEIVQFVGGG